MPKKIKTISGMVLTAALVITAFFHPAPAAGSELYQLPHYLTAAAGGNPSGSIYANRVMSLGSPLFPAPASAGNFMARNDTAYVIADRINNAPLLIQNLVFQLENEEDGESVADIIVGAGPGAFSDIDRTTDWGIVLTGINSPDGQWEYSYDEGETWTPLFNLSDEAALLLAGNVFNRLRFVADNGSGESASLMFRAWDGSRGDSGSTADARSTGSTTAFSLYSGEILAAATSADNDRDRDGLPNDWEKENGLDPDNPNDAMEDADGDGLPNISEFINDTGINTPDTDSDGVSDGEERRAGTDPLDALMVSVEDITDADADGLPDWWETRNGLNPNDSSDALADSDADGLSNLEEFINDTLPFDFDTDNDGVSDGTERSRGSDPLDGRMNTAEKAEDADADGLPDWWERRNGLNPDNPSDATADGDGDGLSSLEEFINGTLPDTPDTDNDGVSDGDERRAGTDPLDASITGVEDITDTDADGLPDWWEKRNNLNPEDPSNALTDGDEDGLSNLEEFINGTLPFDSDTDNDGVSDGTERSSGSDPLDGQMETAEQANDADADGLPDWWENRNGGSSGNPDDAALDDDGDGLDALGEYNAGTNPANADSDGDGVADGAEVTQNSDPLDRNSSQPDDDSGNDGTDTGGSNTFCFIQTLL